MEATVTEAQRAAPPPRLRELYQNEVAPRLTSRFGYSNPMEVPRLTKATLNMGIGEAKTSTAVLDAATEQLAVISGNNLDAQLVLLTLHAGVCQPSVIDRFQLESAAT